MPRGSMGSELSQASSSNSAAQCADIGSLRLCNQLTGVQQPRRKHACQSSRYRRQHNGAVQQGAFALQNLDVKLPVVTERRQNTQRGGRSIELCRLRPEEKDRAIAGLGMHLQAAQLLGTRLRQPSQDGATTRIGLHKLLSGPQPFGRGVGGNPDQVLFCNPQFDQPWGMGAFGWPYQQDLAPTGHQPSQCG